MKQGSSSAECNFFSNLSNPAQQPRGVLLISDSQHSTNDRWFQAPENYALESAKRTLPGRPAAQTCDAGHPPPIDRNQLFFIILFATSNVLMPLTILTRCLQSAMLVRHARLRNLFALFAEDLREQRRFFELPGHMPIVKKTLSIESELPHREFCSSFTACEALNVLVPMWPNSPLIF